jgi:hypothetical protein
MYICTYYNHTIRAVPVESSEPVSIHPTSAASSRPTSAAVRATSAAARPISAAVRATSATPARSISAAVRATSATPARPTSAAHKAVPLVGPFSFLCCRRYSCYYNFRGTVCSLFDVFAQSQPSKAATGLTANNSTTQATSKTSALGDAGSLSDYSD